MKNILLYAVLCVFIHAFNVFYIILSIYVAYGYLNLLSLAVFIYYT